MDETRGTRIAATGAKRRGRTHIGWLGGHTLCGLIGVPRAGSEDADCGNCQRIWAATPKEDRDSGSKED